MRHDTVLRVNDSLNPEPAINSVTWEATKRRLQAQAEAIDATFATLGARSNIAEIVRTMMSDPAPASAPSPQRAAYDQRVARLKETERWEALCRRTQAELAVPLSKRIVPGFSKVY